MALVDYSDSEESDTEQPKAPPPPKPLAKHPAPSNTNFAVDTANPQKIRVKLADAPSTNGGHDEEPAPKRPRIGGGGFSGFNSLLPPPKRDADSKPPSSMAKAPARKVFSLKTGAEPGFSRESDAELKQFFAQQDAERGTPQQIDEQDVGIPNLSKETQSLTTTPSAQTVKDNAFMFKPLSVARNPNKKKKPTSDPPKPSALPPVPPASAATPQVEAIEPPAPSKKISLFSTGAEKEAEILPAEPLEEDDKDPVSGTDLENYSAMERPASSMLYDTRQQNLGSIASDLNLSAAERRQLFGRDGKGAGSAINVANFNTDQEYLANEELRATGEQVQHNPLRAIAPGKHSLRQLVNAAQGQKDALEDSFAQGRRNKKEAGNKYGW